MPRYSYLPTTKKSLIIDYGGVVIVIRYSERIYRIKKMLTVVESLNLFGLLLCYYQL